MSTEGEKNKLVNSGQTAEKSEEVEEKDKDNSNNEDTKEEEEEFDPDKAGAGPIKDRSCTDVICLGLLISFIAVWVLIAIWAFQFGDPSKLMYPTDSFGDVCGRGDFSTKPYLMFFDLTKCISLTALTGCPTPQVFSQSEERDDEKTTEGLCV